MLVSVHNPTVDKVDTLNQDEPRPFHVVTMRDNHTGGEVDLFIDADWSQWDAMVAKVTEYRQGAAVRALGTEHGRAAGAWVIDGNTSAETLRTILSDDYELDIPAPLSGEWSDGVTESDVYYEAGVVGFDETGEGPDWLLVEYEAAFTSAYHAEVMRAAAAMLPDEPEWRQTACRGCGLDIEGMVGGSEWRDRGNNTMCPGTDEPHEPVDD